MEKKLFDPRKLNADNVYYQATVTNNNQNKTIPIQFEETKSSPLIDIANNYYISVLRLEIPNNDVPLFYFIDNAYSITMVNGAAESKQIMNYISDARISNNGIYTVQQYINSINAAIIAGCAAVGIVGADIPYVYINQKDRLTVHFSDSANWLGNADTPVFQLWFNWNLYEYFQTLKIYFNGTFNALSGKDYRIFVQNNQNGNYVAGTGYEMSQEAEMLELFIDTFQVLIISNTIPVNREGFNALDQSGNNVQFGVVTDFLPKISSSYPDNFTPFFYTADQPRLIDLIGSLPINKIDFAAYYVDRKRVIRPLNLLPGQSMNIKFGFFNKALYNNKYNNIQNIFDEHRFIAH